MLELQRGSYRCCDGVSRREALRLGTLGVGGLTLPGLLRGRSAAAGAGPAGFGRAKSVILLWMGGGPSHFETFDPKPDAAEAYRGPSRAIDTPVPGMRIHEWWPRMAMLAKDYAIVRSIHHGEQGHTLGDHWMQTGYAPNRADERDQRAPYFGAVISEVRRTSGTPGPMPDTISVKTYGSYGIGGFNYVYYDKPERLGPARAPLRMTGDDRQGYVLNDLPLPAAVTPDRLSRRGRLARLVDRAAGLIDHDLGALSLDTFQSRAYGLITRAETREAFDLSHEPGALQDRYGRDGWGKAFLMARRLVERGVPVVSVSTGNWDTHGNLQGIPVGALTRMKDHLCPAMDRCFSALLSDLKERGLLDDTLVLWMGDFGRSPKIEGKGLDVGRDHWGHSMNVVVAGGGTPGGVVVGSTTPDGGYPDERPLRPIDLIATIYHKAGVPPDTLLTDTQGRPWEIAAGGEVIRELL